MEDNTYATIDDSGHRKSFDGKWLNLFNIFQI